MSEKRTVVCGPAQIKLVLPTEMVSPRPSQGHGPIGKKRFGQDVVTVEFSPADTRQVNQIKTPAAAELANAGLFDVGKC